ncbi:MULTISPECIES: hypothetical protein [unclassified Roseovarius]|uniref:hypothetical protein n=1 Tax=unclassified Roseovarius TaxID=2614913 RepID=UPI00273D857B|nr:MULTISPECIES: hypothetical protein [unclassified Roseovarius]
MALTAPALAQETPETIGPVWDGSTSFHLFENETNFYTPDFVNSHDVIHAFVREKLGLPRVAERWLLSEGGATVTVYWDPEDEQISYVDEDGETIPSTDDFSGWAVAAVVVDDTRGYSYLVGRGLAPPVNRDHGYLAYSFSVIENFMTAPHLSAPVDMIDFAALETQGVRRTGRLEIGQSGFEIVRLLTPQGAFMSVTDKDVFKRFGEIYEE